MGFPVSVCDTNETVHTLPLQLDKEGVIVAGIQVLGVDSEAYKQADELLSVQAMRRSATRGRMLDLKNEEDAREQILNRLENEVAIAVAVTVGWFGIEANQQEFKFSKENADRLYRSNATLRAKVIEAISVSANFLK